MYLTDFEPYLFRPCQPLRIVLAARGLGAANPRIARRASFFLAFAVRLGYIVLRFRRKQNGVNSRKRNNGLRPQIGFTCLDGMVSLSLLLQNASSTSAWAEELEIFIIGLAEQETSEPPCQGIHTIPQAACSGVTLAFRLCEAIYKAAGSPPAYIFLSRVLGRALPDRRRVV
jgi:hypothetical protein